MSEKKAVTTRLYSFPGRTVPCYFDAELQSLGSHADPLRTILIVDEQVQRYHGEKIRDWRSIVVPGNEGSKSLGMLERVLDKLVELEADRKTMLIGIGGGVVTDLTGFAASIYMRGIPYAFVPTTLLAQVDASIGGKNGINYGSFKNMLGVIRQPEFLLFDHSLLDTLPETEWHNGFAEIIKYACICDAELFAFLEENRDRSLAHDPEVIRYLVGRSADIKCRIVQEDEFESGPRRLLNFGHTVGHAVEKLEAIPHGQAVAKGMAVAAAFSVRLAGLPESERQRIVQLIGDYRLPVTIASDAEAIARYFRMDKKREGSDIHFVLLKKTGAAFIRPLPLELLSGMLDEELQAKKIR
jgi:3-dehydroquinate synthase